MFGTAQMQVWAGMTMPVMPVFSHSRTQPMIRMLRLLKTEATGGQWSLIFHQAPAIYVIFISGPVLLSILVQAIYCRPAPYGCIQLMLTGMSQEILLSPGMTSVPVMSRSLGVRHSSAVVPHCAMAVCPLQQ